MFGPRIQQHNHTYHEHRAPTETSVRLLKDFEREAERKILSAIRVEDCQIDCVVHRERESLTNDYLYAVIFQIKGEKHKILVRIPNHKTDQERVEAVIAALAEKIAVVILSDAVRKTFSKFGEF